MYFKEKWATAAWHDVMPTINEKQKQKKLKLEK